MNRSANVVFTIARKEYSDAIKNKLFLSLLVFLMILTLVSILVASFSFQGKVLDYNTSVQLLKQLGKLSDIKPQPQFFPLQMLRGVINYLEIIGAIIGIILGYLSIAKEKGNKTLQLILSRPVKRSDIISGKILGNSLLIISVLSVIAVFVYLAVWLVGGVKLLPVEVLKLSLAIVASYIYIMFFFILSSIMSLKLKRLPHALIICFVIWLIFVLIIPQIGDTMDPDNQIPGGFFQSMHIAKPQEKEIMAKFSTYETTRNALEESSVTKHYERLCFALLGIKEEYNQKDLSFIFKNKWNDLLWLFSFFLVSALFEYSILINKKKILGED